MKEEELKKAIEKEPELIYGSYEEYLEIIRENE